MKSGFRKVGLEPVQRHIRVAIGRPLSPSVELSGGHKDGNALTGEAPVPRSPSAALTTRLVFARSRTTTSGAETGFKTPYLLSR